jgi:hypothetical protein
VPSGCPLTNQSSGQTQTGDPPQLLPATPGRSRRGGAVFMPGYCLTAFRSRPGRRCSRPDRPRQGWSEQ